MGRSSRCESRRDARGSKPTARRWSAVAIACGSLASCVSTEMTGVWRDPSYAASPVKQVVVVAISTRQRYRKVFEDALAKAFLDAGFPTAMASSAFPPDLPSPSREQLAAHFKERGADLLVVQRIARSTALQHSPGAAYEPESEGRDWYYFWSESAPAVSGPDEYSETATMLAETSVYAVRTGSKAPIWTARSTTFEFANSQSAAASLEASLVRELRKAGILVR